MEPALLPESLRTAAQRARREHRHVPIVDENGNTVGLLFDPHDLHEELDILTDVQALQGLRDGLTDMLSGRLIESNVVRTAFEVDQRPDPPN